MALVRGQLDERFGVHDDAPVKTYTLALDFETFCKIDLRKVGLDLYSAHPSCEVLMAAYSIDGGPVKHWDCTVNKRMPRDLHDALHDDRYKIWAFNAQFERTILNRVLDIWPTLRRFRCTMVLSYMHSYTGTLEQIGERAGLGLDKQKSNTGKKLISMFCGPQPLTAANEHRRFTSETHPVEWQMFCAYNVQDVVAEMALKKRLDRPQYHIPDREWDFYALDQEINDRGLPIDRLFVERALDMAERRKDELITIMRAKTGLRNPGSVPQLLPWCKERGYPFDDMQKLSVKKVLTADAGRRSGELIEKKGELFPTLTDECVEVLKLRLQQSRTTPSKYNALLVAMGGDNRMRFVFQFAGAARTARFAGRRFQPQNMTTMKLGGDESTHEAVMMVCTDAIRRDDFDFIRLLRSEPLDALAGLVRSSVRPRKGKKLIVCDLSSIESVVIGYVSGCERLLDVFRQGRDAYKDFATELYKIPYAEVTSTQRKMSKPATLGAGYRLGGGDIRDGKKTGLWGYAENMGIDMTRKEAHRGVATFRRVYKEIPQTWYALEEAIMRTIRRHETTSVGPITFSYAKPYLVCHLPSGRNIYYLKPRINKVWFEYIDKETGEKKRTLKDQISYMGKQQNGNGWVRVQTHGGKIIENCWTSNTRVLTNRGPVPIVDVRPDDLVWDGLEWVSHDGVISQGVREVIPFAGYACTPEHRVDVDRAWVRAEATSTAEAASSFARHYRLPNGGSDGAGVRRGGRGQEPVVGALRLRDRVSNGGERVAEGATSVLRVPTGRSDLCESPHTRHVETPGLRGLAVDEGSVPSAESCGVEELRWPRHNRMRSLGEIVRGLLARYGAGISVGVGVGSEEQQSRLQPGKLPMAVSQRELTKYEAQSADRHTTRLHAPVRSGGDQRFEYDNDMCPHRSGLVGEPSVRSAEVFDLVNCGPNQRFTIITPEGEPILVHNCVQAIARDILREGMMRAKKFGFTLIGSVHDEIICEEDADSDRYTLENLRRCMIKEIRWAQDMPLNASGGSYSFYMKG